jgi:hypothetical protein
LLPSESSKHQHWEVDGRDDGQRIQKGEEAAVRPSATFIVAAAIVSCLIASPVLAQPEKVSVRMAPRPGQTIHMTMSQDMDFEMSFDGASPVAGLTEPMKMLMRSTIAMTQKSGMQRADGTWDVELTYDKVQSDITMNGQSLAAGATDSQLVGKTIVMTYNRTGEIVDVKGLPAAGLTDDAFKQMIGSLYGNLPVTALSVGETTVAPLDFALPLPVPGAAGMKMIGETKMKLVSIDKDAQGRSARFDSTLNGKVVSEIASPDGTSKVTLDFQMGGEGSTVMDLDKGVVRSSLSTSTFDGRVGTPGGAAPAALPPMKMRGTMKVTMSSK